MKNELIPKKGSMDSKKNFDDVKWNMFARRMQKNPFMKNYIFKLHQGICPFCNLKLRNFVLHHTDYQHQCIYTDFIKVPNPTTKRPNRVSKVPNCEMCYKENPNAFSECVRRVVPVHKLCNVKIEEERKKSVSDGSTDGHSA